MGQDFEDGRCWICCLFQSLQQATSFWFEELLVRETAVGLMDRSGVRGANKDEDLYHVLCSTLSSENLSLMEESPF